MVRGPFPGVSLFCCSFHAFVAQERWLLMSVLNSSWQDTIWALDTLFRTSLHCGVWQGVLKVNYSLWKVWSLKCVLHFSQDCFARLHLIRGFQTFSNNLQKDWCLDRYLLLGGCFFFFSFHTIYCRSFGRENKIVVEMNVPFICFRY